MTVYQMSTFAPAWMDDPGVKCKGLTTFFYPNRPSSEVAQAKGVCNGLDGQLPCPFRDECLRYAIDNHEGYGVWGGTSERDRRKIQRARNRYKSFRIYNLEDVRFPEAVTVEMRSVVLVERRQRMSVG